MTDFFAKHGDTLIIVATIVVAFGALVAIFDQRLDAQDRYIDQRLDAQERYIDQRFDAVDQRFDAQDRRIESIDRRLRTLETLMSGVAQRVSRNEGEIDVIRQQLQGADTPAPGD